MQRANPEYQISRRAAFLGASAVVATAGLPVAVKAMEAEAGEDHSRDLIVAKLEYVQERLEVIMGDLDHVQHRLAVFLENQERIAGRP